MNNNGNGVLGLRRLMLFIRLGGLGLGLCWSLLVAGAPDLAGIEPNVFRILTRTETTSGSGTGFWIRGASVLVTNRHVVDGIRDIVVVAREGDELKLLPAMVLHSSATHDLAVLAVPGLSPPPGLPLAPAGEVSKGQAVWTVGYPQAADRGRADRNAAEATLTAGIVNRMLQQPWGEAGPALWLIQHDAKTSHGNSGSPLLDTCGHVLGVNTQIERAESAPVAYNYALGATELRQLLDGWEISHRDADKACVVDRGEAAEDERLTWWLGGLAASLAGLALLLVLLRGSRERVVHIVESYSRYRRRTQAPMELPWGSQDVDTIGHPVGSRLPAHEVVTLILRQEDRVLCVLRCLPHRAYECVIGRSAAWCDQVIDNETVSRRHVRLHWEPHRSQWLVEDLESSNGTRLNGRSLRPYTPTSLTSGAVVMLGGLKLTVEYGYEGG
ncbi:MAG: trypsin-like peptidase domain-containing protein [Candidatus Competibacteraceae bacterium]